MTKKYTATKGKKKLMGITEFDARHYASVGWKVTGFRKPKRK